MNYCLFRVIYRKIQKFIIQEDGSLKIGLELKLTETSNFPVSSVNCRYYNFVLNIILSV